MLQFVVQQLVQVQPAQAKQFFVVQRAALVFQMHGCSRSRKNAPTGLRRKSGQLLASEDDRGLPLADSSGGNKPAYAGSRRFLLASDGAKAMTAWRHSSRRGDLPIVPR